MCSKPKVEVPPPPAPAAPPAEEVAKESPVDNVNSETADNKRRRKGRGSLRIDLAQPGGIANGNGVNLG